MDHSDAGVLVRAVEAGDHDRWVALFTGYRDFYRLAADPAVVERVWGWLFDEAHEVHGLVAVAGGEVIGLAHYRRFARPSTGSVGLWLDDLFVDPESRGHGAARSLVERLRSLAGDDGLSVLRWITADDNERARVLYDQLATATHWVVYDATP